MKVNYPYITSSSNYRALPSSDNLLPRNKKKLRSNRRRILWFSLLTGFAVLSYLIVYKVSSHISARNVEKWRAECEREQADKAASLLFSGFNLTRWDYIHHLAVKLYNSPYPGIEKYTNYFISFRDLKPLENVSPIQLDDSGKVINDVTSFTYPIDDEQRCQKQDFFFGIISAPTNYDKRDSIRNTWIKHLMLTNRTWSASYAFLVGRPMNETIQSTLERESSDHGDLIQVDLMDTYLNLTLKSVSLISWAFRRCGQVRFVVKCDDDVFVNVENLAKAFLVNLKEESNGERRMFGEPALAALPIRYTDTPEHKKWIVSNEEWPWKEYPGYLIGGMYVISRKALGPLLAATQTTPFYEWEDIYITGLCSSKAKTRLWSANGLYAGWSVPWPDACYVHSHVAWHVDSTEHMYASFSATDEYLFRRLSKCIVKQRNRRRKTGDPGKELSIDEIVFKFKSVM